MPSREIHSADSGDLRDPVCCWLRDTRSALPPSEKDNTSREEVREGDANTRGRDLGRRPSAGRGPRPRPPATTTPAAGRDSLAVSDWATSMTTDDDLGRRSNLSRRNMELGRRSPNLYPYSSDGRSSARHPGRTASDAADVIKAATGSAESSAARTLWPAAQTSVAAAPPAACRKQCLPPGRDLGRYGPRRLQPRWPPAAIP